MTALSCPQCQTKGQRIQPVTVESLAQPEVLARLRTHEGFNYCPSADCAVAWFQPETGEVVSKTELKVRVGVKETTGPRPICYCFGHDAAEFEADVRRQGHSDIPAEIAGKCKRGLDGCAEMNPQGSCCLGNVSKVIKDAKNDPVPAQPFAMATEIDCCDVEESEANNE